MEAKQVIVMRKDLNMRKGKMVAQGSHASIAFLCAQMRKPFAQEIILRDVQIANLTDAAKEWILNSFKKICVSVDSEEELLEIHQQALDAGLEAHLITDSGFTEFGGVPTKTCVAIGPNWAEDIDKITGELKLL